MSGVVQIFHNRQAHPSSNLNRSVDLYGKGIKGPCMTFGYPPISPLKPIMAQTMQRATDLK